MLQTRCSPLSWRCATSQVIKRWIFNSSTFPALSLCSGKSVRSSSDRVSPSLTSPSTSHPCSTLTKSLWPAFLPKVLASPTSTSTLLLLLLLLASMLLLLHMWANPLLATSPSSLGLGNPSAMFVEPRFPRATWPATIRPTPLLCLPSRAARPARRELSGGMRSCVTSLHLPVPSIYTFHIDTCRMPFLCLLQVQRFSVFPVRWACSWQHEPAPQEQVPRCLPLPKLSRFFRKASWTKGTHLWGNNFRGWLGWPNTPCAVCTEVLSIDWIAGTTFTSSFGHGLLYRNILHFVCIIYII